MLARKKTIAAMAAIGVWSFVPWGTAAGQTAASTAASPFSIPAGTLSSALLVFGQQSGLQVSYAPEIVQGKRTGGASGPLTPQAALSRLLAGTGLSYRFANATTVTVYDESTVLNSNAQVQLDVVEVHGSQDPGVDGFVASRSDVGTKTNTPIIEVPQSISVVTQDELVKRNALTDAQALRYTPGVVAEPFGGHYTSFFNNFFLLRGFNNSLGGDYMDGMRVVSYYGRFEPYGYDRIEVLKGPSSVLYGQIDPGGVINRVSKRPTTESFNEAQIQAGSYQRYTGMFDFGGPIDKDKQFLYRVTGLWRDGNVPFDFDFGHETPDDRKFIAPAFTWRPTNDTTWTVLAHYLKDHTGLGQTYVAPNYTPTRIWIGQNSYDRHDHEQFSVTSLFEHRFSDSLVFRQNARYMEYTFANRTIYGDYTNQAGDRLPTFTDRIDETQWGATTDTQLEGKFSAGWMEHTVLLGVDTRNGMEDSRWRGGVGPTIDLKNPDYNQPVVVPRASYLWQIFDFASQGVYLQDQIKFAKQWILTVGGRYDWSTFNSEDKIYRPRYVDEKDDAFTKRIGLTYLADNGLAPYASYSESFLPTGGTDFFGTPFEPTTGQQYEIGVKYQPPGTNAFVTLSVFDLTQQNVLTPDPAHQFASVQTGEINSRGIELEAVASLPSGWDIHLGLAYNDVTITEATKEKGVPSEKGNRPRLVPEITASGWIDYTFKQGPLAGLAIGGGLRFVGDTYIDDQNTAKNPGYTLADLMVSYDLSYLDPTLKGATFKLNVNNVFDKEYSTCWDPTNCSFGYGRVAYATLGYRW